MINPRPRAAVEWSAPTGTHVGTVTDTTTAVFTHGVVPVGHTPVMTATGVVNVMTIALRPYAPSADVLADMRTWLADIAPTGDDAELVAALSTADVVGGVARLYTNGVAQFLADAGR